MTPADAAELLTLVSAYDNRSVDEMMVRAWAFGLADIAYDDAIDAIHHHHRASTDFAKPAHIRAIAVSKANTRADQRALAAIPAPDPIGQQRIRQILTEASRNSRIPDEPSPHPKTDPSIEARARRVACPWCQSPAGSRCQNLGTGKPATFTHEARTEAAKAPVA
jgi:hypothetical protein